MVGGSTILYQVRTAAIVYILLNCMGRIMRAVAVMIPDELAEKLDELAGERAGDQSQLLR